MPIFDFECTNEECDYVEDDVILSVQEYSDKQMTCPVCKGLIRQAIRASSFRLIGGGWERDGYSGKFRHEHKKAIEEYDYHRKHEDENNRREGNIPFI